MSERLQDVASGRTAPRQRGFGGWIAGRCQRREYWMWVVPWIIAVGTLAVLTPGSELILGIPLLLIWIRRLHDLGWTGWLAPVINILVGIVGFAGVMLFQKDAGALVQGFASFAALIALGALPGQARTNEYGPPPGRKEKDLSETFG